MSDQTTSSATPAQPDSAAPSTATSSAIAAATEPSAFGTSRGSGLARGKRATVVAPSAANAAPRGDYKPTAVQVIVAEREYQNPFAPETPPAAELPAPVSAPEATSTETATVSVSTAETAPASSEPVITASPLAEPHAAGESAPTDDTPAEKASITILPPAEPRRPATSWDSSTPRDNDRPSPRREDRPSFRPERAGEGSRSEGSRNTGPGGQREGRREGREPRFPREPRENRPPRENRENRGPGSDRNTPAPKTFSPVRPSAPAPSADPKSGGFVGWLKGLFGGAPAETPKPSAPSDGSSNGRDPSRFDDRGGSRRRQGGGGGGGRRFDQRGPREGQGQGNGEGRPRSEGEGQGGEGGGNRRRRHRGGRGRNRGDFGGPESRSGGNRDGGDSPSAS